MPVFHWFYWEAGSYPMFTLSKGRKHQNFCGRKTYLLNIFGQREKSFPAPSRKFFGRLSKLHSTSPYEQYEDFSKKRFHFVLFGHWAKKIRPGLVVFAQVCRNCILRVRRNIMRKIILWKKLYFISVPDLEQRTHWLLPKIFRSVFKRLFHVSIKNFEGKCFSLRIFIKRVSDAEQNLFKLFSKFSLRGFLKLHSTCPYKHYAKNCFSKKTLIFSTLFRYWAQTLRCFFGNFWADFSKHFYMSIWTF